jgi:2,3-dihydroxybiphenyl 1,2-dioxygenase
MEAGSNVNVTASVYGAVRLGYVQVDSSRLAEWKRFAIDGIGLGVGEDTSSLLTIRNDDHASRLIIRKRDAEDVRLGIQADDEKTLQTILSRLRLRDVAVREISGEEAEVCGVAQAWRFVGPKRLEFDLFTQPRLTTKRLVSKFSGFVTGETGMGHVAISTRVPDRFGRFLEEIFDAKLTDYIEERMNGIDLKFRFFNINSRHHSFALAASVKPVMDPFSTKIQHMEMQVTTLEDVGAAYRRCRSLDIPISLGMGQHTNDKLVSFYTRTPSGFYFEVGWDPTNGATGWTQTTHHGVSIWGHKPQDMTTGEKLGQVITGVSSLFRREYYPY